MAQHPHVVSGVVRDSAGNPVPQARVYFTAGPGPLPEIAALTDASGAFSLTASAAGDYTLECAAEGLAPVSSKISVRSGDETRFDLTFGS
jgi:hypothetical protein